MIEPMKSKQTFHQSEIQDGDIICFQRQVSDSEYGMPSIFVPPALICVYLLTPHADSHLLSYTQMPDNTTTTSSTEYLSNLLP